MNGMKELFRDAWKRIVPIWDNHKRAAVIATGVVVATAVALSFFGSGPNWERTPAVHEEEDHH
jgi:hypothetical protein